MVDEDRKNVIEVDASWWASKLDLYQAILPALGAPDWHGKNMNALIESIVGGEINVVEPPYTLRIRGTTNLPTGVAEKLDYLREGVADAREESHEIFGRDVDVDVELLP